ncbi:MAG: hypothetical protein QM687_09330 [Ferruginibacter sp.]
MGDAGYFRVIMIHHPPNLEARHPRLGLYGAKRFREAVAEHGAELDPARAHPQIHDLRHSRAAPATCRWSASPQPAPRRARTPAKIPPRYNLFKIERLGTAWSCTMREFGFQRLSPDIVLRLSLKSIERTPSTS